MAALISLLPSPARRQHDIRRHCELACDAPTTRARGGQRRTCPSARPSAPAAPPTLACQRPTPRCRARSATTCRSGTTLGKLRSRRCPARTRSSLSLTSGLAASRTCLGRHLGGRMKCMARPQCRSSPAHLRLQLACEPHRVGDLSELGHAIHGRRPPLLLVHPCANVCRELIRKLHQRVGALRLLEVALELVRLELPQVPRPVATGTSCLQASTAVRHMRALAGYQTYTREVLCAALRRRIEQRCSSRTHCSGRRTRCRR